jgi:hypothetical protein
MSEILRFEPPPRVARPGLPPVFFNRREFDLLLGLYGRMVAAGEWRDYAIGSDTHSCTFAFYKRTGDEPAYRVVKVPALAKRQGAWSIVTPGGRVLKRGHELPTLLRFFEPKDLRLV